MTWVYRRVTYLTGPPENKERVRFEVGYVAVREGEEYGHGAYFHTVETYTVGEDPDAVGGGVRAARDQARQAVHYLNGGVV